MPLAREALLRYHMCYLERQDSNNYVEDALSDAIRDMVINVITYNRHWIITNIRRVLLNAAG